MPNSVGGLVSLDGKTVIFIKPTENAFRICLPCQISNMTISLILSTMES